MIDNNKDANNANAELLKQLKEKLDSGEISGSQLQNITNPNMAPTHTPTAINDSQDINKAIPKVISNSFYGIAGIILAMTIGSSFSILDILLHGERHFVRNFTTIFLSIIIITVITHTLRTSSSQNDFKKGMVTTGTVASLVLSVWGSIFIMAEIAEVKPGNNLMFFFFFLTIIMNIAVNFMIYIISKLKIAIYSAIVLSSALVLILGFWINSASYSETSTTTPLLIFLAALLSIAPIARLFALIRKNIFGINGSELDIIAYYLSLSTLRIISAVEEYPLSLLITVALLAWGINKGIKESKKIYIYISALFMVLMTIQATAKYFGDFGLTFSLLVSTIAILVIAYWTTKVTKKLKN